MQVNFYATYRPIVGKKTVQFDLPSGSTPNQLLEEILRTYPPLREQMLDESGKLFSHVHIIINGRDVQHLPLVLETALSSEDKIDIFPPVGGGCAS
jgi:molybdopterin synthase sulfur carrier subunit